MFDTTDPRASLAANAASSIGGRRLYGAHYGRFYQEPPQQDDGLARQWFIRGQNFIVAYAEAQAGATFVRTDQVDEYVVLLPEAGTQVEIAAQDCGKPDVITRAQGPALIVVPPGPSTVQVIRGGRVVRLVSHRADLAAAASNAAAYAEAHDAVAPLVAWPEPPGEWKVRVYDAGIPEVPGRFGRIWRCTTFMVNWLVPQQGPRDPKKLSPHHHEEFEQGSLILDGQYVQHLRWPWGVDLAAWRADDHELCKSPSMTIIPPPAIHTSQSTGTGCNTIVDIFCPPRIDFSEVPGWVLNANDYPMPGTEGRDRNVAAA